MMNICALLCLLNYFKIFVQRKFKVFLMKEIIDKFQNLFTTIFVLFLNSFVKIVFAET